MSLPRKIFLSFGSLCAILLAIGAFFFFSLRGIERLNEIERQSTYEAIEVPYRLIRNAGERQAEIFRCIAAANPEERAVHEAVVTRLTKNEAEGLETYAGIVDNDAKRRLLAKLLQTSAEYAEKSNELLAMNRTPRSAETAVFALTTQIDTYERYGKALAAILHVEEAEGNEFAGVTKERISQSRVAGNILIMLAVVVVLGTAVAVTRMVRRLRGDKLRLLREVDEHERAQLALRQAEARYRLLVDHSPDAILVICEGKIVFVNPAAVKLLGAEQPEQLIGLLPADIVHAEDRDRVALRSREVAAGQEPTTVERRMLRLDGSTVEVEATVISFLYEEKPAIQVILRDNTEQKAAADQLAAQEKQYRLLFEDNPSPMWVFDVQSLEIMAVNQAAIVSYGYSREEFLTLTLRDIRPAEDVPALIQSVSEANGPSRYGGEWRHLRKDGSSITAAVYSSPTVFNQREARMTLAVDHTARAEAERKVRESEATLALAQHVAGVGSWEYQFTKDGRLDRQTPVWSEEAYRIFGLSSADPISTEIFFQAVHLDDRAALAGHFTAFLSRSEPLKTECRITRPDGTERVVYAIAERIFDPHTGKPAKIVGTFLDITERRAVEEKLREADEKYRLIFDNALEGIFQSTPDGRFISANPAFARMLGYASPEELIRERNDITQQSYAVPEKRQDFKRLLEETGVVNDFEFEAKRKDGSTIWMSENVRLVRGVGGEVLYYEGTAQDITERKLTAEELQRSIQRFRCFTQATSQIIWQTDPAGQVLEDLPTWRAYTGQTLEETLEMGWTNCIHPEDRAPTLRRWTECIASKSLFEVEYRLRGSDGIYRLFLVRGVPVLNPQGAIREWVGTSTDITARKQAEEVLAESERRFRFLNNLGDATRSISQPKEIMATVTRLLGAHLRVSRCAYAEVGKDGDQLTVPGDYTDGCASMVGEYRLSDFGWETHSKMAAGRTFVIRDVDAELTVEEGAEAFNAIQVKAIIACPLIKNGELLAAMAVHHLEPRQWTDGDISLVQEVVERCWSIIERARAELVLRRSEEHLSLVIAASNDGIFEHDFRTDIVTWSDRMYEMLGLDRRSFTPSIDAFTELLHPDDRASFQASVSGQMVHGGRYDAHTRIRRQDGSYGNFLGRGRVLLDGAGRPARIIGSMADLTSLLEAEQKMVEQAKLLNLAQDAIMVWDMDDRVEFWNHGAEALYGWTAPEVCGRLSADFLHQENDATAVLAAEDALLKTGAWSGECHHMTKRGDTVIVRSRWTLVRDEQGVPKSKLVINTDITEQKKVEEKFLRAQRLESIGTLASGVAHDLNNILLPIMMAAPILREEMHPVERDKFLDIVEGSAKRGAEIIKQVLTFARGADGDRVLLQPIYLLEEVANIAGQTFPKSITLRTTHDESIRSIEADPTQLHQVLLNFCINARDAMPNGGKLCLGAENFDVDEHYASVTPGATAGPHVMLQVTDTGSGIPSDVVEKIFDPFFTTKGIGEGTGLGLSTVAGIVKSHGGFLKVYSEPGHTSFKVFLPAKEPVDNAGLAQAEPDIPGAEGQTILVVDDEPSIREVAQLILESHGYRVLVAEDGPEALALFAQQAGKIAAVVTDLAMPLMNGLMLVRALHRIEPSVKIIVSTGRNDESQQDEMIALKVDACLLKPFTTRQLLLKLSQVLHSSLQDAA